MIDGHTLLADWFFLIAAILLVLIALATWSKRALPSALAFSVQSIAIALIALGFWVL